MSSGEKTVELLPKTLRRLAALVDKLLLEH
jgi:hypothetical protein